MSRMSNALLLRGIMEIHHDRSAPAYVTPLEIVEVSVAGDRIVFQTENGRRVSAAEYNLECRCKPSFVGFSVFFTLDCEDALSHVRIHGIRLRHRVGILCPTRDTDFCLCMIMFAVECLPLTRHTLLSLAVFLEHQVTSRTGIYAALKESCLRLVYSSLYLHFDVATDLSMQRIPKVFVLHRETRRSRASVVSGAYFRVASIEEMNMINLNFVSRRTKEGRLVANILNDVIDDARRAFCAPDNATRDRV